MSTIETTEVVLVSESAETFYKVQLHGINRDNKVVSTVAAEALTTDEISRFGFLDAVKTRDMIGTAMNEQGHPDWRKKFAGITRVITTITKLQDYQEAV